MKKDILVFYHGECDDGYGAYLSAYLYFKDNAEYVAATYRNSFLDHVNQNYKGYKCVYLLDVSFPLEIMEKLIEDNDKVILIDHHETAIKLIPTLRLNPKIVINLDMTHSGAVMAWQHFWPGKEIPLLLKLIEDVDLWKLSIKESTYFSKALRSQPRGHEFWLDLLNNDERIMQLVADGYLIEQFFNHQLKEISQSAKKIVINEISGLMINASHTFTSELGTYLAEKCGTFAMLWRQEGDGTITCSLRSVNTINVANLAERFGGGGHARQAAFRLKDLTELLKISC